MARDFGVCGEGEEVRGGFFVQIFDCAFYRRRQHIVKDMFFNSVMLSVGVMLSRFK